MKRNQYVISIVTGLLVGAVVALLVGNTITAILVGVIVVSIAGWMCSLQWSKAKEFAVSVADSIDVREAIFVTAIFLSSIKRLISSLKRLIISLVMDVNGRKRIGAAMVITIFSVANMFLENYLLDLADLLVVHGLGYRILPVIAILLLAAWVMVLLLSTSFSLLMVIALLFDDIIVKKIFSMEEWYCQLEEDNRGALAAIVRMLYIRTGNALRIIAYPFVLIPWGFIALANNKTGIATLSAMALSGAHLSVAYFVGGINAGNVNFWLSLAAAVMVGVAIGRKIGETKEESLEFPPLPVIRFRHQVELIAG